jgi:hypothetical protein
LRITDTRVVVDGADMESCIGGGGDDFDNRVELTRVGIAQAMALYVTSE